MYFGSVRFFKHLILTVTALLIIVPTVLCILLAVDNGKKSDEIDRLNSQLSAQSQVSQISDDQSRTSSATESSDNVKAEPSVTESVKPETSAVPETSSAVPETTKAPETTPASSSAVESTDSSLSSGADSYTSLFPTLYADKYDGEYENSENTVYLTFDDAPSQNTVSILNTLRDYEAPATFFVTGKADASILLRMRDEGHAIGNHTLSHDYARIYKSPQAFWNDFDAQGRYLQGVLGYLPTLIRFPGGSNNTVSYNYGGRSVMKTICYQAKQYGYLYFDWNVSSGDADKTTVPKDTIVRNVLNGCKNKTDAVVLMHQSSYKTTTAQALPEIIRGLQDMGFVFVRLNEDSVRPQFLR